MMASRAAYLTVSHMTMKVPIAELMGWLQILYMMMTQAALLAAMFLDHFLLTGQ